MTKGRETLAAYKVRVIDPISDTYCGAKWYNATIWLGHGQTTSCHHPPAHRIPLEEIKDNPSAIHNTQHKKKMRKMMQEGERPTECEYCWKVEDLDRGLISDRTMKTITYSDELNASAGAMPWDQDVTLRTLEISFDRTCNFSCSYCNPAFSTSWVKDIKKYGAYQNIISDGRGHFTSTAPWAESATKDEADNPYIQAFWKWWESDLKGTLEEIRITGGEPLMAPSVWKLFQWFRDNPENGRQLRFAVNSNLNPKKEILDKLIELSHHIPHLDIYTSNESVGAHSEYIRDGMEYKQWLANIERLITEGKVNQIIQMMTINGLCLPSLTEFMDDMLDIKRRHGNQYCGLSLNILRFPSFQSCAMLPENIKQKYKNKLQAWYDYRKSVHATDRDPKGQWLLNEWEYAQVERLIDYLDVIKTPHQNTADQASLNNDFKNFYLQYDMRRGKDFFATFPQEYIDFMNSIDVPVPTREQVINVSAIEVRRSLKLPEADPVTDKAGYVSDEVKKKPVGEGWDTVNDTLGVNK